MYSTYCCSTAHTRLSVTLLILHCLSCSTNLRLKAKCPDRSFSYLFLKSFEKPLVHHPGAECGRHADYSDTYSLAPHSDLGAASFSRHYISFVQNNWF